MRKYSRFLPCCPSARIPVDNAISHCIPHRHPILRYYDVAIFWCSGRPQFHPVIALHDIIKYAQVRNVQEEREAEA